MKYHFKIKKEKNGYSAKCIELKGCLTQGDTLKELRKNMKEALNSFLDEPHYSKVTFPRPKSELAEKKDVEAVKVNKAIVSKINLKKSRKKLKSEPLRLKDLPIVKVRGRSTKFEVSNQLRNKEKIRKALAECLIDSDLESFNEIFAAHIHAVGINEIKKRSKLSKKTILSAMELGKELEINTVFAILKDKKIKS